MTKHRVPTKAVCLLADGVPNLAVIETVDSEKVRPQLSKRHGSTQPRFWLNLCAALLCFLVLGNDEQDISLSY